MDNKKNRGLLMHSKIIEDISTIAWRCQSQEGLKKEMNLCRESIRNHEEENGSTHGFECKKRWCLTKIHLKWHRAMSDIPIGWKYHSKL
jgi:hypothetical protein